MIKKDLFIINILFIISIILIYSTISTNNFFEYLIVLIIFLNIIPILFNKLLNVQINHNKETVNIHKNILYMLLLFSISLIISYIIIINTNALYYYKINYFLFTDKMLIFYYLCIIFPIILIYNYFLNKFVYNLFKLYLYKYYILFLQLIIVFSIILLSNSSLYSIIPYIAFIPFAFIVSYKTKSFIYGSIAQFLYIIAFDVYYINFYI